MAFIYILWQLSGVITLNLGSLGTLHLPGYLVWVGIIYSSGGTYFTFKIGRPLQSLNFEQQRREATFRYAATNLRSHSEQVALYRGEKQQRNVLQRLFDREHRGIGRRLLEELHDRVETFIRMMQQDVLLADRFEDVGLHERFRHARRKRRILQVGPVDEVVRDVGVGPLERLGRLRLDALTFAETRALALSDIAAA